MQGVGFRYATAQEAERLGLTGWVRNRADRSVEAEFQGEREPLDAILAWLERGPALARVDRVEPTWLDDPADYASFTVKA